MKKKVVYVILIITAIGLAVTLFGKRASQDTILAKEIDTLLKNGETQIDLTGVTDFNWNQVSVFGPYTLDEVIEDSMGIKFKGDNGGIDILDDRFLLVFADEKYAIKTVILSRKHGSYSLKDNKFLSVEQ
ncbi:hypothetical protein ACQKNX_06945 [Lysinibacillus sp. NPDC093712]|uniref:hypothetical protein n=1 Tax=Lysinibacillus sp. NPDC093712 TaxID=3390579 RepID=UPI003D089E37